MKLGVVLPSIASRQEVLELARFAEGEGFASVWAQEGLVEGNLEPLATLSALAAVTQRIEVGAYMINASLRDPVLTSRAVSTTCTLAPNRTRVIFGTGWNRSDYDAFGAAHPPPNERVRRTGVAADALKACTNASVEIAGVTEPLLDLAARVDGWSISADALDVYHSRASFLRHACARAGRDVAELRRSCLLRLSEGTFGQIEDLLQNGMHDFLFEVEDPNDLDGLASLAYALRSRVASMAENE